jgi:hypothetical protein
MTPHHSGSLSLHLYARLHAKLLEISLDGMSQPVPCRSFDQRYPRVVEKACQAERADKQEDHTDNVCIAKRIRARVSVGDKVDPEFSRYRDGQSKR